MMVGKGNQPVIHALTPGKCDFFAPVVALSGFRWDDIFGTMGQKDLVDEFERGIVPLES